MAKAQTPPTDGAKLDAFIKEQNGEFGEGSLMKMSEKPKRAPAIPTGSIALDCALGIGGVARGRINEIFGPTGGGKTTIALHVAANEQRLGGLVGFIDAEHALDPEYASAIGVDMNSMVISQPDYGEQGLEIADRMVDSGLFGLIIVDSVAALTPKSELEGTMGQASVGVHPKMMSQAMRKLKGKINQSGTAALFINQIRINIGQTYGSPEYQPGGRALPYFATQRIDVRVLEKIKDTGGENLPPLGQKLKVKIVKNKLGRPYTMAYFDIDYGYGISRGGNILDAALEHKIITQKSKQSSFEYKGRKLAVGRKAFKKLMREDLALATELEDLARLASGLSDDDAVATD